MQLIEGEFAVIFEIIEARIEINVDSRGGGGCRGDDLLAGGGPLQLAPPDEVEAEEDEEDDEGDKDVIVHVIKSIYDTIL